MKFIDRCIKDGITSNDIRNSEFSNNVFSLILIDGLDYFEKGELRKKKLKQLYQNISLYKNKNQL